MTDTASGASATRRVRLWHTNAVVTDVPDEWSDEEAQRRILSAIDDGDLFFVSVEGGLEWAPDRSQDEAYQPFPKPDAPASGAA